MTTKGRKFEICKLKQIKLKENLLPGEISPGMPCYCFSLIKYSLTSYNRLAKEHRPLNLLKF